jgi:hypothetical protein
MGTLTVNKSWTPQLVGKTFDSLQDMLEAEYDIQHACNHIVVAGLEIRNRSGRYRARNTYCLDCGKLLRTEMLEATIPGYVSAGDGFADGGAAYTDEELAIINKMEAEDGH